MDAHFRCSFVCPATGVAAASAHCEIASAHQCRASVLRSTSARRIRSAQTCLHLRSQHTPAPQPGKWAVQLLRYEHDRSQGSTVHKIECCRITSRQLCFHGCAHSSHHRSCTRFEPVTAVSRLHCAAPTTGTVAGDGAVFSVPIVEQGRLGCSAQWAANYDRDVESQRLQSAQSYGLNAKYSRCGAASDFGRTCSMHGPIKSSTEYLRSTRSVVSVGRSAPADARHRRGGGCSTQMGDCRRALARHASAHFARPLIG